MDHQGIIAEYVWIINGEFKSKLRVLPNSSTLDPPAWNYDGNTTGSSDLILKPVSTFKNPFQGNNSLLVLCELYNTDESGNLQPHITNTRYKAIEIFQFHDFFKPKFSLKQEYYLIDPMNPDQPVGRPGKHHCGVGTVIGRSLAEDHFKACLVAQLHMNGLVAAAGQGQWRYSIGICNDLLAADELVISRYILLKLAERGGIHVSFHPRPFETEPPSGLQINFSTIQTRVPQGYAEITKIVDRLRTGHQKYIDVCGADSRLRKINNFTVGQDDRAASIRIPRETFVKQCGYLQDRRPNSNADPYEAIARLFDHACLTS